MPVDQAHVEVESQRTQIEEAAEAEGAQAKPFVTGDALANEEQEMARNRKLLAGTSEESIDPRRHFRAPKSQRAEIPEEDAAPAGRRTLPRDEKPLVTSDMKTIYVPPHERERVAPRRAPVREEDSEVEVDETQAVAPAPKAAAVSPEDAEGLRLEREILGGADPSAVSDELPDVEVEYAPGKKISLSRIRAGDEALRRKMQLEQEFAQKQQAMTTAWRKVMDEEARGLRGDLIGAARRLGMSDSEIAEQFERNGITAGRATPRSTPNVTSLPDDADPLAKALFAENRQKDEMIARLSQRVDGMEQLTAQERVQRSREATERARLETTSGVKSYLKATALKMPSMRDASGKLTPTASVLVDNTMLLVDRELNSDTIPEHEAVRARALQLFGLKAREHGITSKADQARRAIEQPKRAQPARAGTTNTGVYPGSPTARAAGSTGAFNWQRDGTDDDLRKKAMRAEMARIEAELTG